MKTDVVIIGAGPAGLVAGEQIAKAGFDVIIFEKSHYPGRGKICGGAVSKKCFIDLNLPKKLIEKEFSKILVNFPDQKFEKIHEPGFVLFQRELFDTELAKKAQKAGCQLSTLTLTTDVEKCDEGIIATSKSLISEKIEKIYSKIAIFADGAKTLAFRKFGLGFGSQPDYTSVGAACDLKWPKNKLDSIKFFFSDEISPFGYGWIFPKKDVINIGVLCLRSKLKQPVYNLLNNFVISQKLSSREVITSGSRLMPQGLAEYIWDDSILIVGDAAGTADPVDGGGIFNAIVSGKIAGNVAIKALKNNKTSRSFLSQYRDLWKETKNYKAFQRSFLLQRMALKNNVNIGFFLKQKGIFDRFSSFT